MAHQSILAYARYRYLKIATAAVLIAIAAYVWDRPPNGRYGGTWLGYTLGTIGALLIVWLTYFGVRKRRYASNAGTVLGWLSAHCYLGTALLVIVTLHAAFQIGWNVHTLAYALMLAVIFRLLRRVCVSAATRAGSPTTSATTRRNAAAEDRRSRPSDAAARVVASGRRQPARARRRRRARESAAPVRTQLSGRDPRCPTAAAVVRLQAVGSTLRANTHASTSRSTH